MAGQRVSRCGVVKPDVGMRRAGVSAPGQHERPLVLIEQGVQLGRVVEPDEHEGIDPVLDQLCCDAQLLGEVVVMFGDHHRIGLGVEPALQGAGRARVQGVFE